MSNMSTNVEYKRTPNSANLNMKGMKNAVVLIGISLIIIISGLYIYNTFFKQQQRGNTVGNLSNYGYITAQGDWFYYSFAGQKGIYKMKSDGSEQTKICNDIANYINVVDDWIYYCNNNVSDYFNIYKIKTNGTDRTNINNEQSDFPNVVGNWIYYINVNDKRKPYKIQIDGNNKTKLNDDESSENLSVVNNYVYYIKREMTGNEKLLKVKTDGSNPIVLSNDKIIEFNVIGDTIYYISSKDKKIYKMKTDGSNKIQLHDDEVDSFNVLENLIYYCNKSDNHQIYKIGTDGSNNLKVCNDQSANINIVGDWIYYLKNVNASTAQGKNTYRVRLDGSDKQEAIITASTTAPATPKAK